MKLFLKKIIIFAILLIVMDCIVGYAMNKALDFVHSRANTEEIYYATQKVESDIVLIGASTTLRHYIPSIIEDSVGLSVFNCGRDGAMFYIQNATIHLLLERYQPKYIIWEPGDDCLEINPRYDNQFMFLLHPYYDNQYVKNIVDRKDYLQKYRMMSSAYKYNTYPLWLYEWYSKPDFTGSKGFKPLYSIDGNYPHKGKEKLSLTVNYDKKKLLEETIAYCNEKNVKLIVASSPRYRYNTIKESKAFHEFKGVLDIYNVPYMDYYNDERFVNDSTLFYDNLHMNIDGATKYSQIFAKDFRAVSEQVH